MTPTESHLSRAVRLLERARHTIIDEWPPSHHQKKGVYEIEDLLRDIRAEQTVPDSFRDACINDALVNAMVHGGCSLFDIVAKLVERHENVVKELVDDRMKQPSVVFVPQEHGPAIHAHLPFFTSDYHTGNIKP